MLRMNDGVCSEGVRIQKNRDISRKKLQKGLISKEEIDQGQICLTK